MVVEVVEGGFLVAVSRENRSSSPSSSNKRSVFWGVFGEAFGWNAKKEWSQRCVLNPNPLRAGPLRTKVSSVSEYRSYAIPHVTEGKMDSGRNPDIKLPF